MHVWCVHRCVRLCVSRSLCVYACALVCEKVGGVHACDNGCGSTHGGHVVGVGRAEFARVIRVYVQMIPCEGRLYRITVASREEK